MDIPKLQPTSRKREFDSYSDDLRVQVIQGWLFTDKTHRKLDQDVLGLDKNITKGYQSMGILHFLGLKAKFHGIFKGMTNEKAIKLLINDDQDFSAIIHYLGRSEVFMSLQELIDEEAEEITKSYNDSPKARAQRILKSDKRPKRLKVYTFTYRRNPDIVVEALLRANGICEICKQTAPFLRAYDGTPYLEVHHVKSLSNRGEDTLDNVLALCPNCHRREHFG